MRENPLDRFKIIMIVAVLGTVLFMIIHDANYANKELPPIIEKEVGYKTYGIQVRNRIISTDGYIIYCGDEDFRSVFPGQRALGRWVKQEK